MYFKSKKISLVILGITSIVCSRTMFLSFDDPEGPNLLVVIVGAAIVYFLSLTIYLFNPSTKSIFQRFSFLSFTGLKRLLVGIFIQIIIVTVFYFCLS
jgi:hypothetical protein